MIQRTKKEHKPKQREKYKREKGKIHLKPKGVIQRLHWSRGSKEE